MFHSRYSTVQYSIWQGIVKKAKKQAESFCKPFQNRSSRRWQRTLLQGGRVSQAASHEDESSKVRERGAQRWPVRARRRLTSSQLAAETSVNFGQTAWHHIPKATIVCGHCWENQKSSLQDTGSRTQVLVTIPTFPSSCLSVLLFMCDLYRWSVSYCDRFAVDSDVCGDDEMNKGAQICVW